jgi:hypothetical protein
MIAGVWVAFAWILGERGSRLFNFNQRKFRMIVAGILIAGAGLLLHHRRALGTTIQLTIIPAMDHAVAPLTARYVLSARTLGQRPPALYSRLGVIPIRMKLFVWRRSTAELVGLATFEHTGILA